MLKTRRLRLVKASQDEKLTLKSVFIDSIEDLVKLVFSEADKNYGTVLIDCEDIAKAEKRVLDELGGHRIDMNVEEALDLIDSKIQKF